MLLSLFNIGIFIISDMENFLALILLLKDLKKLLRL